MFRQFYWLTIGLLFFSRLALADTGVVLEARGDVKVKLPSGQTQPAVQGKKYPGETSVITGAFFVTLACER